MTLTVAVVGAGSLCCVLVRSLYSALGRVGRIGCFQGARTYLWRIALAATILAPASSLAASNRGRAYRERGAPPPPWAGGSPESTARRTFALPSERRDPPAPPWSGSHQPPPPRVDGSDREAIGAVVDSEPAGDPGAPVTATYTVKSGDTLWDIAAQVLMTSDQARIARYWPQIHRANRDVIGRDPNLIFAGQLLKLPVEKSRG